jgi:DNA-binding MarR family transcriptional regulator
MNLVAAIERTTHLIALHLDRELGGLGLTQAEAHVLAELARDGPASPGDLHRRFGHKRSTLTSVLDRLEARGHVSRATDPHDRRSVVITLTRPGRTAADRVVRAVAALEQAVAAATPARDRLGFAAVLDAVEAAVGAQVSGASGGMSAAAPRRGRMWNSDWAP